VTATVSNPRALLERDITESRTRAAVHGQHAVWAITKALRVAGGAEIAITNARLAGRYANDVLDLEASLAGIRRAS
jgi:hypothetical protein